MRSFIAYLFALAAVTAGVWFGFFARTAAAESGEQRALSAAPVILAPVVEAPFSDTLSALGTAVANESVRLTANRSDLVKAVMGDAIFSNMMVFGAAWQQGGVPVSRGAMALSTS